VIENDFVSLYVSVGQVEGSANSVDVEEAATASGSHNEVVVVGKVRRWGVDGARAREIGGGAGAGDSRCGVDDLVAPTPA
jgi:hypothetical protein